MIEWLKHAFAVEPPGPAEPTQSQRPVVEKVCVEVVRRHLSTPALAFLEISRPLNFIGSQALHFFSPLIDAVTDGHGHRRFAEFLEHRGSIDYLCRRIEELEAAAIRRESSTGGDDAISSTKLDDDNSDETAP